MRLVTTLRGGCVIERPKVLYNKLTRKFVMWFHLELKGRVNAGVCPVGFAKADTSELRQRLAEPEYKAWWTPAWRRQIERGMFLVRDLAGGQMSRDMTVFVDDDGKAYHIYSAEDNLTLHIAQLTDDYMKHNGTFVRVAAGGQNEAPTIFKKDGIYWMITSGCTGWAPNAARMFRAGNIFGPWEQLPNPCRGNGAEKTFGAQGTYVFKVEKTAERKLFGGADYVFMADIWDPKQLGDSRHLWLPVRFEEGRPVIRTL